MGHFRLILASAIACLVIGINVQSRDPLDPKTAERQADGKEEYDPHAPRKAPSDEAQSHEAADAESEESKADGHDREADSQIVTGAPEVPGAPGVPKVEVFPVPTTSRCIVIMTVQYMVIYFAVAVVRTYHEFSQTPKGALEAALRAACQTLTYGPMLCVLFIACRMRVEFLSDGKGQPQWWVQHCMYGVTFAVLASTLSVLCIPLVTGKPLPLKEGTCDLEKPELEEGQSKAGFYALTGIRYLILLGLYGGLLGVIVGINTYTPPHEDDLTKLPPPAPAVMCTMIIAVLFFATQLVIAGCRTYTEFTQKDFPKVVSVMNSAATTVEFGPMLAILFLSLRMRALQHDGQPQGWAQNAMYASTGALVMTTILAIVVPLAMGGTMKTNEKTKEVTFEVPNPTMGKVFIGIRYACMVLFYGGAVIVCVAIITFEAPAGPEHTLPVSPTVQCVMNLTAQFFFVYLMMTVMLTVSELSGGKIPLQEYRLFAALEAAKATLAFAPMLAILFVTTRMYALLITDKKGAPQGWVQDGMFMATWSLLISFMACLITGLVMDEVKTDEDGNVINEFTNKYVAIFMTAVRYFAMLLLYGGIAIVIYGLFTMTPETANGRGSVPVVDQTPVGDPPPGPGSVEQHSLF